MPFNNKILGIFFGNASVPQYFLMSNEWQEKEKWVRRDLSGILNIPI